jgi:ribosome biogenesis GTPase A
MTNSSRKFHPGLPDEKTLALVDLFLFLLDARIPQTSIQLARPFLTKRRVVYVMTKEDLADSRVTSQWKNFLSTERPAFAVDARTGRGVAKLMKFLREEHTRINSKRRKGILPRALRLMLFGLPNVGKSSLANRLLGTRKAPFGSKPGLTRGSHWLRGRKFLELLDTPGVVDPSQVRDEAQMKLALVWALPDNAFNDEEVALYLAKLVWKNEEPLSSIDRFSLSRGAVGPNGVPDRERGYQLLIRDFRRGDLGKISLEKPIENTDDL